MYASQVFGSGAQQPSYGVAAPTQGSSVPAWRSGLGRELIDPSNPLFWLGVVLVVTFGAAGLAGSVRLGGAKLSASVGKG
jgi:hypothetical protein